ncbi:MAG: hypothetical protein V2B19_15855 [Pseudomonadota bacterium]
MTPLFSFIWKKAGSIQLTVMLCLSLTADLTWGYVCLSRHTHLFSPLGDIGLMAWIETYGRYNPVYTVWFFILLGLLALLCVNTFVCTTDRVLLLLRSGAHFTRQRFFFKFAPHVMHYAMIVILLGYLCSYLFSEVLPRQSLVPGASLALPDTTAKIRFMSFEPEYYRGERLAFFDNWVIRPRARLEIEAGSMRQTAILSYDEPLRIKGYRLYLMDFAPKKKGGMERRVRIDIGIRKDPGVWLYTAGMILFTLGLVLYLIDWIFLRKIKKEPLL